MIHLSEGEESVLGNKGAQVHTQRRHRECYQLETWYLTGLGIGERRHSQNQRGRKFSERRSLISSGKPLTNPSNLKATVTLLDQNTNICQKVLTSIMNKIRRECNEDRKSKRLKSSH